MTVKTSDRLPLILAAGLLACFVGPSLAAGVATVPASSVSTTAKAPVAPYPHRLRHLKSALHAKAGSKLALKPPIIEHAPAPADNDNSSLAISPAVANANAELTSPPPAANSMGLAAQTNSADAQPATEQVAPLVPPDQLNDVDRAEADAPPAANMTIASVDTLASATISAGSADSAYNDPSDSNRASLVGEILIGIGVMLTLASGVRMFMA